MSQLRRRIGTAAAVGALALGGAGLAGCGDDDNEGAAEEAGQAIDDASNDVENAADDAGQELQEAGDDVDQAVDGDDEGKEKD